MSETISSKKQFHTMNAYSKGKRIDNGEYVIGSTMQFESPAYDRAYIVDTRDLDNIVVTEIDPRSWVTTCPLHLGGQVWRGDTIRRTFPDGSYKDYIADMQLTFTEKMTDAEIEEEIAAEQKLDNFPDKHPRNRLAIICDKSGNIIDYAYNADIYGFGKTGDKWELIDNEADLLQN